WAVALSRDGETVLTGSADKTVRLWGVATGKQIGLPRRHHGGVLAVTLSLDGYTVLTGSTDGRARLWDVDQRPQVGLLLKLKPQSGVATVAFGSGGKTALTGGHDGRAWLWDLATGKPEPIRIPYKPMVWH